MAQPNPTEGLDDLLLAKAQHYARHIIRPLTAAVLTLLGASIIMWALNWLYKPLNMLVGLVMVLAIAYILSRPKIIVFSLPIEGFFAFLRDEDISQGAASGTAKLSRLALFVIYVLSMNAIILATWSFWNNGFGAAMSYWGLWLVTIAIGSITTIGGGRFGAMAKKLQRGYLILVALSLVWNTVDVGYALPEKVSDERGNAIVMFNPQTSQIVADLSPADCTVSKPCFASDGIGVELVPLPKEEAEKRNPKAWAGKALNASESPLFWPGLIIVLMGAGFGFYRTRSFWGTTPPIALGLLAVASYPLLASADTPGVTSGEVVASTETADCTTVAVGTVVTLSKATTTPLCNMNVRKMLVPMDEQVWPGVQEGVVIDWSKGANAPKLQVGAPSDRLVFVVANTADTDEAARGQIRLASAGSVTIKF